ncbi:MAG: hypothetical protein LVQ75_03205 [Candidatus Babeliales bacterium]
MKQLNNVLRFLLTMLVAIGCVTVAAKVKPVRDMKSVDKYVSPDNLVTVMAAYTQPDKPPKDLLRQVREAERALRDICEHKAHRKISMECIKVNLFKVSTVADEYNLKKDPETLFILLFKKGRLVTKIPVTLNEADRDFIYKTIKEGIEEYLGEFIDQKLDELNKLEADIARARAAAPQYIVDPYYNSFWDYAAYHGYYNSYHRPYPYRAGFGWYFGR